MGEPWPTGPRSRSCLAVIGAAAASGAAGWGATIAGIASPTKPTVVVATRLGAGLIWGVVGFVAGAAAGGAGVSYDTAICLDTSLL
jgi:hypothetical protein